MNNNDINIADILRDCPEGMKLYSPIFGNLELQYIQDEDTDFPVVAKYRDGYGNAAFSPYGRFIDYDEAECLLFPSRDMRDWSKFFKRGDLVYNPHSQMYAIFEGWVDDTYTEFNTTCNVYFREQNEFGEDEVCNTECFKRATDGEREHIIKELERYYDGKYNPDTLRVEPVKPECPFKAFDKVLVRDTDEETWTASFFSHYQKELPCPYASVGNFFVQCIPYNDRTAHLLGTTDPYEEGGAE